MTPITRPQLAVRREDSAEPTGTPGRGVSGLLWLTWRQHRWTLLGTFVLAAVLVGWMTYLSMEVTELWHQCHNMACPEGSPQGQRLGGATSLVLTIDSLLRLVQYMPMLIGVFIGVPVLSREHEQRTLLLAWSQDISPARWLWTKLSLLGLFVAAVTAAVAGASDHLEHVLSNVSKRGACSSTAPSSTPGCSRSPSASAGSRSASHSAPPSNARYPPCSPSPRASSD